MLSTLSKGLLITTACITCVASLSAFSLYAWLSYQQQRLHLEERVSDQAHALALNVKQQLSHHADNWHESFAEQFEYTDFILNAHVYTYSSDGELNFLTSYNRPGVTPIASREQAFSDLRQARISHQGIDIMVPFTVSLGAQSAFSADQPPRGYVFVRATRQSLNQSLQHYTLLAFIVVLFAIALALLMAKLLSRFFTRHLHRMIEDIGDIARTRNYSLRLKHTPFRELDMLGRNVNTVLDRIQQFTYQHTKSEAAAAQLTAELEQQVQDRTNALRNANQELLETLEQLHQHQGRQVEAQKMSSLSELVAGISHEINTPLGMAVTATSMLDNTIKKAPDDLHAELNQQLTIVQRNLGRAVELINNFKKLAIEHAGEESTPIDFKQMLEDIITSARAYVEHSQAIEVDISCTLQKPILAKVGIWHQLILSLFDNSVLHGFAANAPGRVEITVTTDNGQLKLVYKDNGVGVPADILRRIFDPFVTSKRGKGNSGLGMHLVYNLVTHTLDGSINCQSAPDEGFEVVIECGYEEANDVKTCN
ncbi:MAG: hypothetical protein JJU03_12245 [Idiomarina sp.]|nr:hypothetical protein [Idiomarina sp.]